MRYLSRVALVVCFAVGPQWARAQVVDELVVESDGTIVTEAAPSWSMDRFASRLGVFAQNGRGFQSQASADRSGPGSEEAWVLQPYLDARVVQPDGVSHELHLVVDVVTAASPDALDAISSASRDTEAVDLDVYTRIPTSDDEALTLHWGGQVEEQNRSVFLGAAMAWDLADDNAVLTASLDGIVDIFDPTQPNGFDPGLTERFTASFNASLSQLLSPTTTVALAYGATVQVGTLGTTWNSVPRAGVGRVPDLLPGQRFRNAASLELRQAIAESATFFMARYRFYADDFDLLGHTVDVQGTQYLLPEVSVRLSYRFHQQSGVRFYMERFEPGLDPATTLRTADSDLAAFDAHELGGAVRWYWDPRGARTATSSYLELTYHHYERSNGLAADVASLGWGWEL